jgi:hypothetical protein
MRRLQSFAECSVTVHVGDGEAVTADLQFWRVAARSDAVTVTADVKQIDVQSPDPAEKMFASEDLLDANPGHPGAPISIRGYPIETASSGIKAPPYFAPGSAGPVPVHANPIAEVVGVRIPSHASVSCTYKFGR